MMRSFLFIVLFFISCSSYGQVRAGLKAGYNSAKWHFTVDPTNWETTTDPVGGFNAGVLAILKDSMRDM